MPYLLASSRLPRATLTPDLFAIRFLSELAQSNSSARKLCSRKSRMRMRSDIGAFGIGTVLRMRFAFFQSLTDGFGPIPAYIPSAVAWLSP